MFYAWGIYPKQKPSGELITFGINRDFAERSSIEELKTFSYPSPDDFDVESIIPPDGIRNTYLTGTGCLSSLFMISGYLRGWEQLFTELSIEKKFAHYYIDRIGEASLEVTRKIMAKAGRYIDCFCTWDDIATQRDLMISPATFREFYLPWYKKIFSLAKDHDCKIFFHICGNANGIIPDLIDAGVDILDPIQVSAKDMELPKLKKRYGKHLCFHGGIDVQTMLPVMKPEELTGYVRRMRNLFAGEGGLILGPSHEMTEDTPLDNILAVYRSDLLDKKGGPV
jgi:uroporphyrinogen decarboxylase